MTQNLHLEFKHRSTVLGEMKVWHMSHFDTPMDYHMRTKIVLEGHKPKLGFQVTVVHFRSELEMSMFALQFGEYRV